MDYITLSGHAQPIPLSVDAKRQLLEYLSNARASVDTSAASDDLIRDLETSIGDTMQTEIASGVDQIDAATMSKILAEAGPLDAGHPASSTGATRLFRIQQGKWFGGLCLGLAVRRQFRVDWVRTIAILLGLVTGGLLGIVYLIALIFIPSMDSSEEYEAALKRAQLAK